jgi:Tfp pilus assembly protein PilO
MALDYRSEYQRYRRYYMAMGPVLKNPIIRAYLSVSASFLTTAIFLAFAIRPTIATIAGLVREIDDKRKLSDRLDAKINSLAILQSDYRSVESEIPGVEAALPPDPALGQAVIWAEKVLASTGISADTLTVSRVSYEKVATSSAEVVAIPIQISFSAHYEKIEAFLRLVYQLPRIFSVSSISISQSNQFLTNSGLPNRVEIVGYYLP